MCRTAFPSSRGAPAADRGRRLASITTTSRSSCRTLLPNVADALALSLRSSGHRCSARQPDRDRQGDAPKSTGIASSTLPPFDGRRDAEGRASDCAPSLRGGWYEWNGLRFVPSWAAACRAICRRLCSTSALGGADLGDRRRAFDGQRRGPSKARLRRVGHVASATPSVRLRRYCVEVPSGGSRSEAVTPHPRRWARGRAGGGARRLAEAHRAVRCLR